jgi:Cu-Zn family superoxide dismutase
MMSLILRVFSVSVALIITVKTKAVPPEPTPENRLLWSALPPITNAFVDIVGDQSNYPNIRGQISLMQFTGGPVIITGKITGIPNPGLHGMHFHTKPVDQEGDCQNVGDHYNPLGRRHGSRDSWIARHVGDEGNIYVDGDGVSQIWTTDSGISLGPSSIQSIVGRSLVIHFEQDDLGMRLDEQSALNGNSGLKIACGNVRVY